MTPLAAMPFINPGFVWAALVVAGIPLLIALLNRRRHREVPWAAMRFLLAANRKSVRRARLEQVLLLLLRTLLLVLLALALARPWLQSGSPQRLLSGGAWHILVLDTSYSMFAKDSASAQDPAFEQQRQRVLSVLQNLPSGDLISVVTMGAPATLLNRNPTSTKAVVRRMIQNAQAAQTHTDLGGALRQVRDLLASGASDAPERVVYIFSDFAASCLAPPPDGPAAELQPLSDEISASARLVLHDVYGSEASNMQNAALQISDPLVGVHRPVDLRCRIANRSERRSAAGTLELQLDRSMVRALELAALEPGEVRDLTLPIEPSTPGMHTVETILRVPHGDVLPLDNARRLVFEVREHIPVLVVDGKPDLTFLKGQAGYLATALAPGFRSGQSTLLSPTVVAEDQLGSQPFADYDVIILCNVRRLEPARWQAVIEAVREGCGLLLFLGDLVDIDHYRALAAELLPARLERPAFADVRDDQFVRLDPLRLSDTLALEFSDRPRSGLFLARIRQYIEMSAVLEHTRGLLYFDNGALAAAVRQVGRGRCAVVGTTANMEWTNLPAKGDFVALVMNLVREVAPDNAPQSNYRAGQTYSARLPSVSPSSRCDLLKPDGTAVRLSIRSGDSGLQWTSDDLDQAGWYALRTPRGDEAVAVNLHSPEGDLAPLTRQDLERALACEFEYIAADSPGTRSGRRSELTLLMVYGLVGLLLIETFLAMKFGHQQR